MFIRGFNTHYTLLPVMANSGVADWMQVFAQQQIASTQQQIARQNAEIASAQRDQVAAMNRQEVFLQEQETKREARQAAMNWLVRAEERLTDSNKGLNWEGFPNLTEEEQVEGIKIGLFNWKCKYEWYFTQGKYHEIFEEIEKVKFSLKVQKDLISRMNEYRNFLGPDQSSEVMRHVSAFVYTEKPNSVIIPLGRIPVLLNLEKGRSQINNEILKIDEQIKELQNRCDEIKNSEGEKQKKLFGHLGIFSGISMLFLSGSSMVGGFDEEARFISLSLVILGLMYRKTNLFAEKRDINRLHEEKSKLIDDELGLSKEHNKIITEINSSSGSTCSTAADVAANSKWALDLIEELPFYFRGRPEKEHILENIERVLEDANRNISFVEPSAKSVNKQEYQEIISAELLDWMEGTLVSIGYNLEEFKQKYDPNPKSDESLSQVISSDYLKWMEDTLNIHGHDISKARERLNTN